jgi:hypothetical protein
MFEVVFTVIKVEGLDPGFPEFKLRVFTLDFLIFKSRVSTLDFLIFK